MKANAQRTKTGAHQLWERTQTEKARRSSGMTVRAPQLDLPCDSPVTNQEDMISGFRREVPENCALLGRDAASSGNFDVHVPVHRWYNCK